MMILLNASKNQKYVKYFGEQKTKKIYRVVRKYFILIINRNRPGIRPVNEINLVLISYYVKINGNGGKWFYVGIEIKVVLRKFRGSGFLKNVQLIFF